MSLTGQDNFKRIAKSLCGALAHHAYIITPQDLSKFPKLELSGTAIIGGCYAWDDYEPDPEAADKNQQRLLLLYHHRNVFSLLIEPYVEPGNKKLENHPQGMKYEWDPEKLVTKAFLELFEAFKAKFTDGECAIPRQLPLYDLNTEEEVIKTSTIEDVYCEDILEDKSFNVGSFSHPYLDIDSSESGDSTLEKTKDPKKQSESPESSPAAESQPDPAGSS